MHNIKLTCTGKNEYMNEKGNYVAEVTLTPEVVTETFAVGAAIGTPNTKKLQTVDNVVYNVTDSVKLYVYSTKESAVYTLGEEYTMTIGKLESVKGE